MSDLEQLIRQLVRDELAKQKPANDDIGEHITVEEYARRWSLSQTTVRTAIREGRLAHTRIGRAVRIVADAKIKTAKRDDPTERARLVLLGGGKGR